METTQLQLEERNETIQCLKNQLKSERKSACERLDSEKKNHSAGLQTQKTKYQGVIKRHQKFIQQLIDEKKELSQKCNVLTQFIKDMESKHQREVNSIVERHTVELQQSKELSAAAEKIRRERWLEEKTSKIKVCTNFELRNLIS